jgi:protease I
MVSWREGKVHGKNMLKRVLIPLPLKDFDPTESAIPWKILNEQGVEVRFATSSGDPAVCDQRILKGEGLGLLASMLQADLNAQRAHA